jgi:hypothetical protein
MESVGWIEGLFDGDREIGKGEENNTVNNNTSPPPKRNIHLLPYHYFSSIYTSSELPILNRKREFCVWYRWIDGLFVGRGERGEGREEREKGGGRGKRGEER